MREGEAVRRGQVLAVLDAEALGQSVEEQNAQLDNTKSRLRLAKVKLDKQRELLGKGFISQIAYDELESDYRVKEGELRAQASQVARAKRLLQDTQVKSPIDGVVFERKVNPGEAASRNMKLFPSPNLSVLRSPLPCPRAWSRRLRWAWALASAWMAAATCSMAKWCASIRWPSPAPAASLFIPVQNPSGQLKVGQFAKGGVVLREVKDQVVVPLSAVRDIDSQPWVMVAEKGRLAKRPVTLQLRAENERQVAVGGIAAGTHVIVGETLGSKWATQSACLAARPEGRTMWLTRVSVRNPYFAAV
ncbi:efflux RND transporter periplasmic adaptor subunit [Chromobacterium sphagni]|uniref:CzcB-like barrel-sandwich hybrid domain-containing protein n=1 Tax=Chromobacterium sphagni TaxID=1903179 RepID=A0ABX3CF33_9NEIS|nr:efflux RND transporter periplasmic adaptor subunit [Chromobacterium sphagni]OHX20759.1 hypothetical protein BI344_14305 [Chromobacterium sphagni]